MEGLCPCGHEPTGSIVGPTSELVSVLPVTLDLILKMYEGPSNENQRPAIKHVPYKAGNTVAMYWFCHL